MPDLTTAPAPAQLPPAGPPASSSRWARRRRAPSLRRDERRTAWAMVSPAVLIVVAVALVPVIATVWLSLHDATVTHTGGWVGLRNFSDMFADEAFRKALFNTTIFTVISVSVELAVGLGVALVMHQRFRGRGLVRAAVLVPWAFPVVVSALTFRLMLQDQVGIISYVAHKLGLAHGSILSDPTALMVSAIGVDIWASTPFMALLLLAGLQTIPEELIEAAKVDGASAFQAFVRITLPLLKPAILVALLFRTLQAWSVYDLFWVLAQRQIDSLSTYVYEGVRVSELQFATGTAAAVFTFASSVVIALVFIKGFGTKTGQES
jgi:trehalose/maltose transport system permease protein